MNELNDLEELLNSPNDTEIEIEDKEDYSHLYEDKSIVDVPTIEDIKTNYIKEIVSEVEKTSKKNRKVDYQGLEDFLATLPFTEQQKIRNYAKQNSIYGNPILETMLMLQYGAVIQANSFQTFLDKMKKVENEKMRELEDSFEETTEIKIQEFENVINKLIDKINNISIEVDEYHQNKKKDAVDELEAHLKELKIKLDADYDKEVIHQQSKIAKPIAVAVKSIPKLLEESVDKHLNRLAKSSLGQNNLKIVMLSMFGAMVGCSFVTILLKFLNIV